MKRRFLLLLFAAVCFCMNAQVNKNLDVLKKDDFMNPLMQARPSTYWMWMNGHITKEGLTADLEYMKRNAYGAAMMFNTGVGIPRGAVDYASPQWEEMTIHAVKEAERLGMELYLQNSPGYSGTGGPWITPEYSMQQLEWTETLATPDKKGWISTRIPRPYAKQGYYKDAFVLAYPALESETALFQNLVKKVSLNNQEVDKSLLADNDLNTQIHLDKQKNSLTFELSEPFEARAITVRRGDREKPLDPHDGPRDYAPVLTLEVSEDGVNYQKVANLNSPALRAMDTPGTASFAPVKGRYFRLTTNRSTNLSEVNLHASERIINWPAKTNYVKDPVAPGFSSQRVPGGQMIDPEQVIDITSFMDNDGNIKWKAPRTMSEKGKRQVVSRWTIVRLGSTTTGEEVAACPDSGRGLDCDKFSKEALDRHFDLFLDPLLDKLKPWCGKTLTALMMDSWEAGKQNWTSSLPVFFRQRKGYDVTPWLLAMTGRVVKSVEATERFLYDMRRTQTDMFNENFLAHFKERAARHGLKFAAEPYGDGNFESLEYAEHLDYPMSEFWIHYIYGGVTTSKMAASTAHLWNRPIVGAECFTGTPFNSKLTEHPYAMKAEGDYMMTTGVNRFVYHVFAHQPYVGGTPGTFMTMGPFGTHLNRNSVWAEQAIGLNIYNARCASILQQGLYAADILYIKDEGISSGIADYDFTEPATPYGYRWDIGSKNILERITVEDGRLTLPHGMNYRILVLTPMKQCSPELLKQVKRLLQQGATIVLSGEKPEGYMGMDANKDMEVKALADELWSKASSALYDGTVYYTKDLQKVLNAEQIHPDFSFVSENKDAQIHFIHRTVGEEEVYFISNHRRRPEMLTATFRIRNMKPSLWDAETGETDIPVSYKEENGMTKVTLSLAESGSVFIVFRPSEKETERASDYTKTHKNVKRETAGFKEIVPVASLDSPIYNTFTISLWAKPETFAAGGRGFLIFPDKGEERLGKGHATVGLAMGQNTVRVYERASANQVVLECNTPIEGWTHVAVVYDDGVPTLYLNGRIAAVGKKSAYICSPAYDVPMAEEQYVGSFEGDQTKTVYASAAWSGERVKAEVAAGLPEPVTPAGNQVLRTLDGAWKVQFPVWSKAPAGIILPVLESLHKHSDFNVKHFSGKATYLKTFVLTAEEWKKTVRKESPERILLDLGRVENIAQVSVNGAVPVLVWKAPYRIDITERLKAGENQLKIEVINLYPNRLIGDEYLPEKYEYDEYGRIRRFPSWYVNQEKDTDRQRILFAPWKYYTKNDPLLEAGLLGPVRLLCGEND